MKGGTWALCIGILAVYVALALFLTSLLRDREHPADFPLGFDFSVYYEAGSFARHGNAAGAYDDDTLLAAEHERFPSSAMQLTWNYPPTFQTLLVPFSFAPYAMAFAAWSLLLLGGHVFVTRHFASRSLLWPLLLFPGAILNLLGANVLVVAALLGGGFLLLDRRPALAGVLFGLATFKPHLAWLVPFALFAGRRHRALVALLVTAAALFALSLLVCGSSAWSAFLARATHSTPVAASGSADWERVPTLYTLLQVLGFGKMLAGIVHGLVAIVAVVTTLRLWRVEAKPLVRSAALVLALLVATPYARMYDFALLLVPIVALAEEMERRPRRSDRLLLSVAWIAPLVGFVVSASTAWLSLVPIALLVRLVRADRNSDSPAPEPAAA